MKIGFIGQGWIGKNYADDFEDRGYEVVRYDLEKFKKNKAKIKTCDIIFIAIPTPSTIRKGCDYVDVDFNESLLKVIRDDTKDGQIIVIKSTVMPGTTEALQVCFPNKYLIHSPEFLTEKTARFDVSNPSMNIIGYTKISKCKAGDVMKILPCAPYEEMVDSNHSEMLKYMINCWFYMKVLTMNTFYDVAKAKGMDYNKLIDMMGADKRVGRTHLVAEHQGGRGAGGHCFIKDFAAYRSLYGKNVRYKFMGDQFLHSAEEYNKHLLENSGKDLDLLKGVYEC